MARALEVPLYRLSCDCEKPPGLPNYFTSKTMDDNLGGSAGKETRWLVRFRPVLGRMDESDRKILLFVLQKMARSRTIRGTGVSIVVRHNSHVPD
jgi:hypothetical protein